MPASRMVVASASVRERSELTEATMIGFAKGSFRMTTLRRIMVLAAKATNTRIAMMTGPRTNHESTVMRVGFTSKDTHRQLLGLHPGIVLA